MIIWSQIHPSGQKIRKFEFNGSGKIIWICSKLTLLLTSSLIHSTLFPVIPPENIRKLEVIWCFQGPQKENIDMKWVKIEWRINCSKVVFKPWKYWSSHRRFSVKKGVLKHFAKFTGKDLCQSLCFHKVAGLRPATLLKTETLAQVFNCEFCDIFMNTFFYKTPPMAAFLRCVVKQWN